MLSAKKIAEFLKYVKKDGVNKLDILEVDRDSRKVDGDL